MKTAEARNRETTGDETQGQTERRKEEGEGEGEEGEAVLRQNRSSDLLFSVRPPKENAETLESHEKTASGRKDTERKEMAASSREESWLDASKDDNKKA